MTSDHDTNLPAGQDATDESGASAGAGATPSGGDTREPVATPGTTDEHDATDEIPGETVGPQA
ncbi:hypothetical protein [Deinococcus maricopensis]|uniref:Uncharacterized protein n=1 Tax=Deinococcus maricopensis (strain DSM 21211 / LMG 22137 / NRRL B-23946 / LB-34) TaxID=709986 RepID=E8U8Q4_DEIML|nr:hypothetical protein [Deinococcus maricopensis]ADV67443.1 hypothetical protein Deima_1795 [Deinococcus maricopensis DSM 21211]